MQHPHVPFQFSVFAVAVDSSDATVLHVVLYDISLGIDVLFTLSKGCQDERSKFMNVFFACSLP
jgi:hypothetical protein